MASDSWRGSAGGRPRTRYRLLDLRGELAVHHADGDRWPVRRESGCRFVEPGRSILLALDIRPLKEDFVMVKPIPDGYSSITPYLIFEDAKSAIDFYGKA